MPAEPTATGVIHDLGYRRYDGPRLGRRHDHRGAGLAQLPRRLRLRPGREGQGRPGDRASGALPARRGQRVRDVQGQPAPGRLRHVPAGPAQPGDDRVRRRPGARARLQGPAQPRAPAVLLPSHPDDRLPARQVRRVHRRVPGDDRRPGAAALRRRDRQRARRRRGLGADEGADPGAARRPDVVGGAGRGEPVPRVADRPPRLRHRRGGDLLPAHLHARGDLAPGGERRRPGRRPCQGRSGRRPAARPARAWRRRSRGCSAPSRCSTGCGCGWAAGAPSWPTTCPI